MMVNIKYVNFPNPGKKMGRLVTQDGQTIWVAQEYLGMFRAGMTTDVPVEQQTWSRGQPNERQVTVAVLGSVPTAAQHRQQWAGSQLNSGQGNVQRAPTAFRPQVIQGGGGSWQSGKSADEQRQIFITGVVGRAMGSGKFTASEILTLTQAASQAYEILSKPPVQQRVDTQQAYDTVVGQGYGSGSQAINPPSQQNFGQQAAGAQFDPTYTQQYLGNPPPPEAGDPGANPDDYHGAGDA